MEVTSTLTVAAEAVLIIASLIGSGSEKMNVRIYAVIPRIKANIADSRNTLRAQAKSDRLIYNTPPFSCMAWYALVHRFIIT